MMLYSEVRFISLRPSTGNHDRLPVITFQILKNLITVTSAPLVSNENAFHIAAPVAAFVHV